MRQIITIPTQVGQVLLSARRARGLSQQKAGVRLGLSQNRLSELEKGAEGISLSQLLAMTALYGLQFEIASREKPPQAEW